MIKNRFKFTANFLKRLSRKTGFTYNEINILGYFFIIPFSWLIILDEILEIHILKLSFVVFCVGFYVGCRSFKDYSDLLFLKTVKFLNYFNRFGNNYIASSVWICIAVPILIYILLLYFAIK